MVCVQLTDEPKNTRGANTTAVSLGNNYGMPLLWAALADKSATWLQCLQNSGAFLPHPVCKCAPDSIVHTVCQLRS